MPCRGSHRDLDCWGFAEAGDAAAQQALSDVCQQHGIRLVGPNCVGVLNPGLGMTATFSSELRRRMPRPGRLALFTQSGALGNALLQSFNDLDIGLAYWVSTGNEADLGVLELLEHAIEDDGVDLIGLYVEGFKRGSELLSLARRARENNKAIMVLRAGQSQLGRAAAVSHTGKLAGAWKVWCDVARQAGLIVVDSLDDMVDLAVTFQVLGYPQSAVAPALGVLTISGGMGVLISDEAARFGVTLPPFAADTQAALRELLPPQMSVANPVDTALFANEGGFGACAEAVIRDPGVGILLVVLTRLAHDYKALLPWLERLAIEGRSQGKALAVSFCRRLTLLIARTVCVCCRPACWCCPRPSVSWPQWVGERRCWCPWLPAMAAKRGGLAVRARRTFCRPLRCLRCPSRCARRSRKRWPLPVSRAFRWCSRWPRPILPTKAKPVGWP